MLHRYLPLAALMTVSGSLTVHAQEQQEAAGAVRGRIVDSVTGRAVPTATVSLVRNQRVQGTVETDAAGTFAVEFSLVRGSDDALSEVVVSARTTTEDPRATPNTVQLEREEIRRNPGSAGDVFRALDVLPGVVSTGEFSSFTVRGKGPRDNLILITGWLAGGRRRQERLVAGAADRGRQSGELHGGRTRGRLTDFIAKSVTDLNADHRLELLAIHASEDSRRTVEKRRGGDGAVIAAVVARRLASGLDVVAASPGRAFAVESRFSAQELGDVTIEIEQLARLVEQLLCLARLDSQEQFQFAPFDAYAVALEVARELAPVAPARASGSPSRTASCSVRADA